MFQLSRMTDYALLVLTRLARDGEGALWSARDLARETELPPPTVSKVLKTLTRAGILASQRGAQGGYGLARGPEAVNVAEVIQAFEGPIALTVCSEGPGKCDLEHQCSIRGPLQVVNDAIRGTLETLDLAAIIAPRPNVAITFANAAAEAAEDASVRRERAEGPFRAAQEGADARQPHNHADLQVRTGER